MEKTPSVMTRIDPFDSSISTESRIRARSSMSLCLNLIVRPNASRQPSMIDAWFMRSQRMTSSLPTSTEMVPRLVWNPVEKRRAFSLRTNFARRCSSSSWMSRVPLRNLEPVQPLPYFSMALIPASFTLGWVVRPR